MVISHALRRSASLATIALAAVVLCGAKAARANDLEDASRLFKSGQHQQALARVNKAIAAKPSDPQARFLKGLILAEQGNGKEAADIFLKLTQDYPELPEPFNNLAVIYASQGQYDKARDALERSIRTHPSYATAYENLGDVYAKLASQAYDKALQLDSANSGAQDKLALARELVGGPLRAEPPAAASTPVSSGPVAAAPTAALTAAPAAAPRPTLETPRPQAPAADMRAAVKPPAEKREPKPPAGARIEEEVVKALQAWALAWSQQDADAYLAHYASSFSPGGGESRSDWEKSRRARVTAPKSVSVRISSPQVQLGGDSRATVTFRQSYRSDIFNGNSTKTMVFMKDGGRWLIEREKVSN